MNDSDLLNFLDSPIVRCHNNNHNNNHHYDDTTSIIHDDDITNMSGDGSIYLPSPPMTPPIYNMNNNNNNNNDKTMNNTTTNRNSISFKTNNDDEQKHQQQQLRRITTTTNNNNNNISSVSLSYSNTTATNNTNHDDDDNDNNHNNSTSTQQVVVTAVAVSSTAQHQQQQAALQQQQQQPPPISSCISGSTSSATSQLILYNRIRNNNNNSNNNNHNNHNHNNNEGRRRRNDDDDNNNNGGCGDSLFHSCHSSSESFPPIISTTTTTTTTTTTRVSNTEQNGWWWWYYPNENHAIIWKKNLQKYSTLCFNDYYLYGLQQYRYLFLLLTICIVWPYGFYCFIQFQKCTDSTFQPIHGSYSEVAQQAFINAYQNQYHDHYNNEKYSVHQSINNNSSNNNHNHNNNIDWNDPMNPPLIIVLDATSSTGTSSHHHPVQFNKNITNISSDYDYDYDQHHDQQQQNNRNNNNKHPFFFTTTTQYLLNEKNHTFVDTASTTTTTTTSILSSSSVLSESSESSSSSLTMDRTSYLYQMGSNFSYGLYDYLMNEEYNCWEWPKSHITTTPTTIAPTTTTTTTRMNCTHDDEKWIQIKSYYSLMDENLNWIAEKTMRSYHGDMAFIVVQYTLPSTSSSSSTTTFIKTKMKQYDHDDRDHDDTNNTIINNVTMIHNYPRSQQLRYNKERVRDLMQAIDNYKNYFFINHHLNHNETQQQQRHLDLDDTYHDENNNTNNNSMMMDIDPDFNNTNHTNDDEKKDDLFTIRYTGIKYFASDLVVSTKHDMKQMDTFVIPLAFLVIGWALPYGKKRYIWMIPVVTIFTTIATWSIIMYWITTLMTSITTTSSNSSSSSSRTTLQISTFTPTIMMSLSLGMGIDYTLFLLARYLEEYEGMVIAPQQPTSSTTTTATNDIIVATPLLPNDTKLRRKEYAIRQMLLGSGNVLILSGLTLMSTFLGLLFLPLSMLQSIGLGSSITILTSLLVNLSIVPALLFTSLGDQIVASSSSSSKTTTTTTTWGTTRGRKYNHHPTVVVVDPTDNDGNETTTRHLRTSSGAPSFRMIQNNKTEIRLHDNIPNGVIPNETNRNDVSVNKTNTSVENAHNVNVIVNDDIETDFVIHSRGLMNIDDNDSEVDEQDHVGIHQPIITNRTIPSLPPGQSVVLHVANRSMWLRLAKFILHPYRGVITLLIICQLVVPIAKNATKIKTSLSFDLLLPSNSPSLMTYHQLEKAVGGSTASGGQFSPYRILFDGHPANITMNSDIGFEIIHHVIDTLRMIDQSTPPNQNMKQGNNNVRVVPISDDDQLVNKTERIGENQEELILNLSNQIFGNSSTIGSSQRMARRLIIDSQQHTDCHDDGHSLKNRTNKTFVCSTNQKSTVYNGIAILDNNLIPHSIYTSAKVCGKVKPHCPIELLHVLDEVDLTSTSKDFMATYVTATLMNMSPYSDEGIEWLKNVRVALEQLNRESPVLRGVQVYVDGSGGIAHDAVTAVYQAFPRMVIITTLIVFVLMGLFFRSIIPPIRSIVSIGLTISFAYGLTVLMFQKEAFATWSNNYSTHFLASVDDELCWLVPVMSFSIMVGLALDYDVFLCSRILEYRLQSYEHRTSIAMGLHSTGSIITAAGLIMSLAFGSLMFSSSPVLYQWSFVLTSAVLFDTCIVRTLVVPILTNLMGPVYGWWPRTFDSVDHSNPICLPEYLPKHQSNSNPGLVDDDVVAGLLRTLEETSEYEPLLRA